MRFRRTTRLVHIVDGEDNLLYKILLCNFAGGKNEIQLSVKK